MKKYNIYQEGTLIEENVELSDEERNHKIRHEDVLCVLVDE